MSHEGVIRGAVTYQRLCAGCHGASGHGDGPRAADALAAPSDLTGITARHGRFDRREVASWIDGRRRAEAHGPSEMPAWGELGLRASPTEGGGDEAFSARMQDLLDYLAHIQDTSVRQHRRLP